MATLRADLVARTSQFEAGMKRAGRSAQKFGEVAKKATKAAAVGVVAVTTALGALTVRQIGVIDQTAKTANKLGILVSELQALRMVADEAGIGANTLDMALQRMTRRVSEAAMGTGEAQGALKEMGLSAQELAKLAPEQQFEKIATTLEGVESSSDRVRLAFKLFDSEGVGVINMLGDMSGELEKARAFNEKFNIELTAIDAAKVEEAQDTFGRLGKAVSGIGNTLAVYFSPIITEISNQLLEAGVDGESFGNALKRSMEVAGKAIDFVRQAILGIRSFISDVSLAIDLMVLDATSGLFDIAKAAENIPLIGQKMRDAQAGLLNLNKAAQMSAENSLKKIKQLEQEAGKFQETSKIIADIQDRASKRAEEATKRQSKDLTVLQQNLDKATAETKKLETANDNLTTSVDQFKVKSTDALTGFISDIGRGADALTSFRSFALQVLEDVLKYTFSGGNQGGGGIGEAIAGGLSDIVGGLFGGGDISSGSTFNPATSAPAPKPSFATGSRFIPRDMTARVHRGEMIIPRGNMMQSPSPNIVINNNAPNTDVRAGLSSGGESIEVIIDQITAGNIRRRGTQTSTALRQSQRGAL